MRSIPRYPEVREDGSMWVPLAPPPAPTYRQLTSDDRDVVGQRAVVSYSTEWLMDLRILTEPNLEHEGSSRWVVHLCDEGAWHDLQRHGIPPRDRERLVSSVNLVFLEVASESRRGVAS